MTQFKKQFTSPKMLIVASGNLSVETLMYVTTKLVSEAVNIFRWSACACPTVKERICINALSAFL